jgi:hypothetical protein
MLKLDRASNARSAVVYTNALTMSSGSQQSARLLSAESVKPVRVETDEGITGIGSGDTNRGHLWPEKISGRKRQSLPGDRLHRATAP